jgi:hypothetical protein
LSFRQAATNATPSFSALPFPFGAVVSADGRYLYVGGDGGLAVLDFASVCPPAPVDPCRAAGRSVFVIDDRTDDGKDFLLDRWTKGDATSGGALGDPVDTTTSYALCVYDDLDPGPTLIVDAMAPDAGLCPGETCWRSLKAPASGLFYRRPFGVPDGLTSLLVKAGASGQSRVILRGTGARLPLPGLPLVAPVTVQVLTSDGKCWGATYTGAHVIRNGAPGTVFKAKAP